jgi:DNA-binding beta-propeller fold protein YncE
MLLLAAAGALLFASIPYPQTGQPGQPAPFGEGSPASKNRLKLLIILVLLAALGWVLMLGIQYLLTRQSITQLTGVPPPIGGLFEGQSRYLGSLEGVQRPLGVAVSDDGKIYVSESGGEGMVRVFNRDGDEIAALAPPGAEFSYRVPLYVAISPKDEIYVSDRFNRAIYIWAADGSFVGTYQPQSVPAEDWHPMGLAFDRQGNFYVTDVTPGKHRVLVFDSSGALTLQFGKEGQEEGDFWYPNGIAVDGDGRIYVADGNNGRLQVFDAQAGLLYLIPRGFASGDLGIPRGVALDGDGHLLVVDTSAHAVKVYDISGDRPDFIRDIGESGSGDGQLRFPNGVALADGKIYVTDRENGRVQIWSY